MEKLTLIVKRLIEEQKSMAKGIVALGQDNGQLRARIDALEKLN